MNLKIKFRESFRPFAPAVLAEQVSEYFLLDRASPYMMLVAPVLEKWRTPQNENGALGFEQLKEVRSAFPAVTHVDYSARVQTVNGEEHPRFYELLKKFEARTGCPMLINTSFNVRGEPIVCTPEHAYACFMRTNMDYLVMGNFLLDKKTQPAWAQEEDWERVFELD